MFPFELFESFNLILIRSEIFNVILQDSLEVRAYTICPATWQSICTYLYMCTYGHVMPFILCDGTGLYSLYTGQSEIT